MEGNNLETTPVSLLHTFAITLLWTKITDWILSFSLKM